MLLAHLLILLCSQECHLISAALRQPRQEGGSHPLEEDGARADGSHPLEAGAAAQTGGAAEHPLQEDAALDGALDRREAGQEGQDRQSQSAHGANGH